MRFWHACGEYRKAGPRRKCGRQCNPIVFSLLVPRGAHSPLQHSVLRAFARCGEIGHNRPPAFLTPNDPTFP